MALDLDSLLGAVTACVSHKHRALQPGHLTDERHSTLLLLLYANHGILRNTKLRSQVNNTQLSANSTNILNGKELEDANGDRFPAQRFLCEELVLSLTEIDDSGAKLTTTSARQICKQLVHLRAHTHATRG